MSVAMTVVVLGSTVPSGLYTIYERQWGLPASTTSVVFAAYILGVIVALLLLGHLSDHLGRRPMMLTSVLLSIASSLVFAVAGAPSLLYLGRFLSGLSVGIGTGTFTAALREHARSRVTGALLSTVITSGALAAGPLASGLAASHVADPLHTPYLVYAAVATACLVPLIAVHETRQQAQSIPWVNVNIGVPRSVMPVFIAAAAAIACAYAANGLFQVLVPLSAASSFAASDSAAASYTSLMLAASAIVQVPSTRLPPRLCSRIGLAVLGAGFASVAAAIAWGDQPLLAAAAVVSGIGNGMAFRGSLANIASAAPGRESQLISSYYLVGYIATAVPPLLAGALSMMTDLSHVVATLTIGLALISVANAFVRSPRTRADQK